MSDTTKRNMLPRTFGMLRDAPSEVQRKVLERVIERIPGRDCDLGRQFFKRMLNDPAHGPAEVLDFLERAREDFWAVNLSSGEKKVVAKTIPKQISRRTFLKSLGISGSTFFFGLGLVGICEAFAETQAINAAEDKYPKRERDAKQREAFYKRLGELELEYPGSNIENYMLSVGALVLNGIQAMHFYQKDITEQIEEVERATKEMGRMLKIEDYYKSQKQNSPAI